jgi:hypothetical protein
MHLVTEEHKEEVVLYVPWANLIQHGTRNK